MNSLRRERHKAPALRSPITVMLRSPPLTGSE